MEMSILNVEVSRYNNCKDNTGTVVNLLRWLQDDSLKAKVAAIRAISDKDERDKLKKSTLPGITVCGTFSIRKKECLLKHSGLICIDIDLKDNKHLGNYDQIKRVVSTAPFVAYCGISVSGTGYFVIIPVLSPKKHDQHFEAIRRLFERLKINIDITGKDINRLRFYSWDDAPYINHSAVPFSYTREDKEPISPIKMRRYKYAARNNTTSKVEASIKEITARCIDITDKYKHWYEIGFALATEFREAGRQYFHQVSQYHSGYKSDEADKKYTELLKSNKSKYSIGTFFYQCQTHGIKP